MPLDELLRRDRLNKQTADELIEKAVKKAIKDYDREQRKERSRKALHNTKLLLKNYKKIQSSIEEAISDAKQLEENLVIIDNSDELYIESIRRSKLKSLIVLAHIDKALDVVRNEYGKKGSTEKYDIFMECMIDGVTFDEAAIKYYSSKTSISRWINEVTKEVSIQLFGVEGVDLI